MWVPLSDVCQGGFGIVGMPEFVRIALLKAQSLIACPTRVTPLSYAEYLNRLAAKQYRGQTFYPPDVLERIAARQRWYVPEFAARPTVDHIAIESNACVPNRVRELPVRLEGEQVPTWDCTGKFNAMNFFQFAYHERTAFLDDPMTFWQCGLEYLQLDSAAFATFVQLLGMRAELRFNEPPPHVVKNICERSGLSPDELAHRKAAFPLVVDYCLDRVERLFIA